MRPGAIILAVNDETIREDMDIHTLLNRQAGQPVRLTIKPASGGEEIDEVVTPEPYINGIVKAHSRWVEQRKVLTEKLSKGRLGYIHIAAMDTTNYQNFVAELFGPYANKEAVVIDVRFNAGGNLADRLIADLAAGTDRPQRRIGAAAAAASPSLLRVARS